VTVTAPPRPPEPTDTNPDDVVEALIEEARQRARRRRRTYGAVAIVFVLAAAATVAIYGSNTSFGERFGIDTAGGAGADIAGTGELVASMYTAGVRADGFDFDLWLYLYADGRVISTVSQGWREQRLTPDGVELVRDEIIASGLFDPDQPPPGSGQELQWPFAQIQVRNGDRLVDVSWTRGREWTPDYLRLVGRLGSLHERALVPHLQSWLPASAWADVEVTPYVPDRYAICTDTTRIEHILSLLPAAAAELLDTAPPLLDITPEMDPATYERTHRDPGLSLCFDLPTERAQSLAASLNEELTPNRNLWVPVDPPPATIHLYFMPILPHGVVECACYG
jgi:hypothetical protein